MKNVNLENDGERMDIDYFNMNYDFFDIYQKSHYKRYEFASTLVKPTDVVGDMACGSAYGSMMLLEKSMEVYAIDIDISTMNEVANRYKYPNLHLIHGNLLDLKTNNKFDKIVSFETLEHFNPDDLKIVLKNFHNALKDDGMLIFSTPYNQEQSQVSMKFHKSFYLTEEVIENLLGNLFTIDSFHYQDYQTHDIKIDDGDKNFIIVVCNKNNI